MEYKHPVWEFTSHAFQFLSGGLLHEHDINQSHVLLIWLEPSPSLLASFAFSTYLVSKNCQDDLLQVQRRLLWLLLV